jgi:hypothetical protein
LGQPAFKYPAVPNLSGNIDKFFSLGKWVHDFVSLHKLNAFTLWRPNSPPGRIALI